MHRRHFTEALAVFLLAAPAALAQTRPPTLDDFIVAVRNDNHAVVRDALARGMDPNSVSRDGWPALAIAAREGNLRTVEVLLAAGVKVDLRNPFGDTPLMLTALNGHLEIAKRLRGKGASVEGSGWTPLAYAATGGHDEVVRFLLGEGARIDAQSPNGTTALMMAVREGRYATALLLIDRGANVAIVNQDGATALAWAERSGDEKLVARLKQAGAK
jgi:ankyrin repeat protein